MAWHASLGMRASRGQAYRGALGAELDGEDDDFSDAQGGCALAARGLGARCLSLQMVEVGHAFETAVHC